MLGPRKPGMRVGPGNAAGAAGPSLFAQVLALSAGRPVFTADNHVIDGLTGKTRGFVDWNDSLHLLSQPVDGYQVALPTPQADFNGAVCASFSSTQIYESTLPPTAYPWLVDGSGVIAIDVFAPTATAGIVQVWLSCGFSGSAPALLTYGYGADVTVALYRAGGVALAPEIIGTIAAPTPRILQVEHGLSRSPQVYAKQTGSAAFEGSYDAPPVLGSPPESPLRLCTTSNNDFPATMRWRARLFFPLLTPPEIAIVHAWLLQDCGATP